MFFEYPYLLWLEFLLVPLVALYIWRETRGASPRMTVPDVRQWTAGGRKSAPRTWFRHLPFLLFMVALALIIFALARPRSTQEVQKVDTEGIDIVLTMDVSTSMLARDFKPDRIGAAKDIAIEFIASRPSDRIGIVVFAGESFTQSPLTSDRVTLINLMKEIETGLIDDGTAIGNGLATAVARLKDSDAKSKVVILLTDGVNNCGEISPVTAADIARTYDVRVYTIGVGAKGTAPYPVQTPWGIELQQVKVEIDEPLLQEIATKTGGKYFRATDNTKLMEIYSEINEMEKSKTTVESFPVYTELFLKYAYWALAALLLAFVLKLFTRRLPL